MASDNFIDECNKEIMRLTDKINRIKQLTNYLKGGVTCDKIGEEKSGQELLEENNRS